MMGSSSRSSTTASASRTDPARSPPPRAATDSATCGRAHSPSAVDRDRQHARPRHAAHHSPARRPGAHSMTETDPAAKRAPPAGRRRSRGRPAGLVALLDRREGFEVVAERGPSPGDRARSPLRARPRRHGRPAAGWVRHRGLPGDPGGAAGDEGRDADLVPGREAVLSAIIAGASGYLLKQIRARRPRRGAGDGGERRVPCSIRR